jgi:CRP/FNR family transcriptional regulator, cyclic AMP receptor protein
MARESLNMTQPRLSPKQALKATPLFAALDEAELDSLTARSGSRLYAAGELLFSEGEPCQGLYIVMAGRVRVFKTSASGREQVLTVEGPGGSIAELPVFDGGPYPASASAVEKSEFLFVSRNDLRAICLQHPEVSLKLLQVVGARLRRLVGIIEELSFTTAAAGKERRASDRARDRFDFDGEPPGTCFPHWYRAGAGIEKSGEVTGTELY